MWGKWRQRTMRSCRIPSVRCVCEADLGGDGGHDPAEGGVGSWWCGTVGRMILTRSFLDKALEEVLRAGAGVLAESPVSSPVLVLPKKNAEGECGEEAHCVRFPRLLAGHANVSNELDRVLEFVRRAGGW
jgi:hypothetical protein